VYDSFALPCALSWLSLQVLEPLGADISGSQFLEPDGTFPNHIPNPENKAAMQAAVSAVQLSGGFHCGSQLAAACCDILLVGKCCASIPTGV